MKLRTKLLLWYLVVLAFMTVLGGIGYQRIKSLVDTGNWVSHTREVIGKTYLIEKLLVDMETGERGFLLTGQDTFLEPYVAANEKYGTTIAALTELVSDNPAQVERLKGIDALVTKWREVAARPEIAARRKMNQANGSMKEVSALIQKGTGKSLMDSLRGQLAEFVGVEEELLNTRWVQSEGAEDEAAMNTYGMISGTLLCILSGAVAMLFITLSVTRKLTAETSRLQTASTELKAASQQQLSGAAEQTAATWQVSATIKELSATATQIAERCRQVTKMADDAVAHCNEGGRSVQQAQEVMGKIKGQVETIVQHMLGLGKNSQLINMAVDVISELSEQTTILSYNAAIEAAAAGDAGQTFAVVADQVGKLAERAKEAARDVRSLVDDIQKSTNTTIMATEDGLKAADQGLSVQAHASEQMAKVADAIRSTLDSTREIEMSSKQQSTASEQVEQAIDQVVSAAKESEASAEQTLGTADLLVTTAENLEKI